MTAYDDFRRGERSRFVKFAENELAEERLLSQLALHKLGLWMNGGSSCLLESGSVVVPSLYFFSLFCWRCQTQSQKDSLALDGSRERKKGPVKAVLVLEVYHGKLRSVNSRR